MRRRTLFAALAATLLAGGCAGDDAPIHIAIAGPVGQANGRSMRMAAELAIDEINRNGGIEGRPLELVIKDDNASPEQAIKVAAELRDDPRIIAVIGHVNSAATLAAAEVYNDSDRGVVQISPASSSPLVTEAGPWTFRVCPSDLQHGPALAQWASDRLGRKRAAVLYRNDEYGRGVAATFTDAYQKAGGTVIASDPYLPEVMKTEQSYDPYLERALQRGMDVLVIAGQADGGLEVLRAARRLGFDGPVIGADGLTGLKDAGAIAEGVYISSAFLPDRNTPAAQRFVREYGERFNELPDHRGAMTYDAIHLVAQALRETGADRAALRDYLAEVGNARPAVEGVSGTMAFDQHGDVSGKEVAIGVVKNGQLLSAGS